MPQLGKVNTNVGLKKIVEGAYLVYLGSANAVLLDGGPELALVYAGFPDKASVVSIRFLSSEEAKEGVSRYIEEPLQEMGGLTSWICPLRHTSSR